MAELGLKLLASGGVLFLMVCAFGAGTVGHDRLQRWAWRALAASTGVSAVGALIWVWSL